MVLPKHQRLFLSTSLARSANVGNGGSNGNNGKTPSHSGTNGSNRNDSGKTTTTCPKCGDPCLVMQPFACKCKQCLQSICVNDTISLL